MIRAYHANDIERICDLIDSVNEEEKKDLLEVLTSTKALEYAVNKSELCLVEKLIALGIDIFQITSLGGDDDPIWLLSLYFYLQKQTDLSIAACLLNQALTHELPEGVLNSLILQAAAEKGDIGAPLLSMLFDKVLSDKINSDRGLFDINYRGQEHDYDLQNITPLNAACRAGNTDVVDLLLKQAGIEINKHRLVSGYTPLMIVSESGIVDIFDRLLDHSSTLSLNLNQCLPHDSRGPEQKKARYHITTSETLFDEEDYYEDEEYETATGFSALMLAVVYNKVDIVTHLLSHRDKHEQDVNLELKDSYGRTAFMIACLFGRLDIVKYLTIHGVHKTVDNNYNTPLMLACMGGHANIVTYLMGLDFDLNATNEQGKTALMMAVELNHDEIVKCLIQDKRIDTNIQTQDGKIAIDFTTDNDNLRELLANRSAYLEQAQSSSSSSSLSVEAGSVINNTRSRESFDLDNTSSSSSSSTGSSSSSSSSSSFFSPCPDSSDVRPPAKPVAGSL